METENSLVKCVYRPYRKLRGFVVVVVVVPDPLMGSSQILIPTIPSDLMS